MFRLTALVRERSYLTVLSDGEVLTVHSESPHRPGEATGWAGRRVPVHCCASGMALLLDHDDEHIVDILRRGPPDGIGPPREARDYLARVQAGRRFGFTIADRIFDPELVGVGAAVRNRAGTIIAAVNLSGPPATRVEPQMQVFAGRLLTMVRGLQHAIEPRARVGMISVGAAPRHQR